MSEYIEREKIEKFFDGIYDCADLTFEPYDQCCAADDCAHCKWFETKNAIRKRILSIPAADVREVMWISVEERLPEDGEEVLCYYEYFRYGRFNGMYKTVDRGYFFNGHFGGEPTKGRKAKVLYWMPLPEPPKEET